MIKEHCFTDEWLDLFKKQKDHSRIDKIILEKMIYALHLLERLTANGLNFVFKGGTSLLLLLEQGNRFSIDIDIISKLTDKSLKLFCKTLLILPISQVLRLIAIGAINPASQRHTISFHLHRNVLVLVPFSWMCSLKIPSIRN